MLEEKTKKKKKLSKESINIIRTTQRNNIDLTHIADNKANVLLSLNAIMITFLIPLVLSNVDVIFTQYLHIPLIILAVTCFTTIYISAIVLKPSTFNTFRNKNEPNGRFSPFFFGNYYKMEANEFYHYIKETLAESEMVKKHLAEDMFFIGRRLGFKMTWIRRAFNIFLIGLFLSLVSTAIVFSL